MGEARIHCLKKRPELYSVVLYEVKGAVGEQLEFVYENGRCGMNHYFWGSELDFERSRSGEVEHNYIWDEEETRKLFARTGSKNGKELVQAIYDRFHTAKSFADKRFIDWCEEKGIQYDLRVWS